MQNDGDVDGDHMYVKWQC